MADKIKDKMDISTALNEVKAKIAFLADVNMSMCERMDGNTVEVQNGLFFMFLHVQDQISEIDEAVLGNNLIAKMPHK